MSAQSLVSEIDAAVSAKHVLNHTFYRAWSAGELNKEILKDYAEQYYHHVVAFPAYLSSLHAHTDDSVVRTELVKNLFEEEGTHPTHPELWLQFAESLGAAPSAITASKPRPPVQKLIEAFKHICALGSVEQGLAALYAYESQIPAVAKAKIAGLRDFYGLTTKDATEYFSVHMEADVEHSDAERRMLERSLSQENVGAARAAADEVLQALWNMLSELCARHGITCAHVMH